MTPSEKTKYISNWIKDYVDQMPSKAQSLVIGISGGIDSSVSSTLSAMTGLRTIVLTMHIKQKKDQHDLSLKHQEWLIKNFKNVEAHTINLDKLFESFSSTLSKFDNTPLTKLALPSEKVPSIVKLLSPFKFKFSSTTNALFADAEPSVIPCILPKSPVSSV